MFFQNLVPLDPPWVHGCVALSDHGMFPKLKGTGLLEFRTLVSDLKWRFLPRFLKR